jgi:hypothetical protein
VRWEQLDDLVGGEEEFLLDAAGRAPERWVGSAREDLRTWTGQRDRLRVPAPFAAWQKLGAEPVARGQLSTPPAQPNGRRQRVRWNGLSAGWGSRTSF